MPSLGKMDLIKSDKKKWAVQVQNMGNLWRAQNLPIEQWTAATVDQVLATGDRLNLDAYENPLCCYTVLTALYLQYVTSSVAFQGLSLFF